MEVPALKRALCFVSQSLLAAPHPLARDAVSAPCDGGFFNLTGVDAGEVDKVTGDEMAKLAALVCS